MVSTIVVCEGAPKLRGIWTASQPPGLTEASRSGISVSWPSSQCSVALLYRTSTGCPGRQVATSPFSKLAPGWSERALASISAELSTPSNFAFGQRCRKSGARLPAPQPRSTTCSGASAGILASRSSAGRRRSPANLRYCEGSQLKASLDLCAREFHYVGPFGDVLAQEPVELLDRHAHRLGALLGPDFAHLGRIQDLANLGIQALEHRPRRACGSHEAEPDARFVARDTGLGDGRNLGQHGGARFPRRAHRLELPGAHVGRHGGDGVDHHLHLAAEDAGARAIAALVRYMH